MTGYGTSTANFSRLGIEPPGQTLVDWAWNLQGKQAVDWAWNLQDKQAVDWAWNLQGKLLVDWAWGLKDKLLVDWAWALQEKQLLLSEARTRAAGSGEVKTGEEELLSMQELR